MRMAELIVFLRDKELVRTPIRNAQTTIGRDASCDVVLDNAGISRTHAVLVCQEGRFYIRDAGSQNGLTVNGRDTSESPLRHGDVVGINKFRIHLSAEGGVSLDELQEPARAVPGRLRNIVGTVAIDATAARGLQAQLLARQTPIQRSAPAATTPARPARTVLISAIVLALALNAAILLR